MMREGINLVSRSNIGEDVIIRAVVANPLVDEKVLLSLITSIERHGYEIINNIPSEF